MSAVPEPCALLFSCFALALLLSFVSASILLQIGGCTSASERHSCDSAHISRGVQVQQRNGCFFCAPAAAKHLPLETNWQFVEKGNGQCTQQQHNHDHRRCYGNGCWLLLVKDPQLKSGVSADHFQF